MRTVEKPAYKDAIAQAQRDLAELQGERADLSKKLAEVEKEIHRLNDVIRLLSPQTAKKDKNTAVEVLEEDSMAMADHVAMVLRGAGKPLSLTEIVSELVNRSSINSKNPTSAVWLALKRGNGKFKRVSRGLYTVADEKGPPTGREGGGTTR
jgi:septal ring factor EnvC (AmiA/AmiB activator)